MNPMMGGLSNTLGLPAEQAIARQVIYEVLPQLETLLMALARLQRIWNTPQNGIPTKIGAALMANQSLAGYSPKDWIRWGETLLALDTFLSTELTIEFPDMTSENVTPESVLLTRYTQVE